MLFPEDLVTSSKVDALAEQLRRIAYERGPDSKMPTAREIRDALGVGMSTVNSALQALEDQNVIYRKHGVGIFVSPRLHRKTIAVLMDDSFFLAPGTSPFWSILWGLLAREAQRRSETRDEGYVFNLVTSDLSAETPLPEMLVQNIRAGQVHGVLGVGVETKAAQWLRQRNIPTVNFAGAGRFRVQLDNIETVREGVRALAEQGCQTIGLWRPVTPFRPTRLEFIVHPEEIGAFTEGLHAYGLTLYPDQVRQELHLLQGDESRTTLTHQEQGFLLATEVFTDNDPDRMRPDGIVITDDMFAWGVITALNRLGVRVGTDLKIATHVNRGSNVLFGYENDLTLIEVDPEEIVRAMFDLLDRQATGEIQEETIVKIIPKRRPASENGM